ncbi:hypothetical protein ACFLRT_02025 [Acidobacteriota bacterium]
MLQGFNITIADSLGNIIALLNETFSHNHPAQFSNSEFQELYPKGEDVLLSALGEYSRLAKDILIIVDDGLKYEGDDLVNKEIKILKNEGVEFQQSTTGYNIFTYGFSIKNSGGSLKIEIDPGLTAVTFPIVEKIINSIRTNGLMGITLWIYFIKGVRSIRKLHKVTARLYNTDIKIGEEDGLVKGCVKFKITTLLEFECKCKTFAEMKLDELLNLLFERGILYVAE